MEADSISHLKPMGQENANDLGSEGQAIPFQAAANAQGESQALRLSAVTDEMPTEPSFIQLS